jgi:hypothetical protein
MSDIEDCIIDGGGALQLDCPDPIDDACFDSTGGAASVWQPKVALSLASGVKTVQERLVAIADQQIFTLQTFTYVINTGAISVHKNGLLLTQGIDWAESSSTRFGVTIPCTAGDVLVVQGIVGFTANIDVRDTDIYVNNYQSIRDYAGTETLLYAKGVTVAADGGQVFFQLLTGMAIGFFVDNNASTLVPTGGDGSQGWVSRQNTANYETVAALLLAPVLNVGDIVETAGYNTKFDRGGNNYLIVAGGTGTADGGGYIDIPALGLQAQGLFPNGEFYCTQWGATGDGTTDDTLAIMTALAGVSISGGGKLIFPVAQAGTYRCNLTLNGNVNIEASSIVVRLIPAIDAPIIQLSSLGNVSRLDIYNFTLDGAATKATFTSSDGFKSNPATGLRHRSVTLTNCIIRDCGARGVNLVGGNTTGSDERIERFTLQNCEVLDNTLSGILAVGNVSVLRVLGSEVSNNGDAAVDANSNIRINTIGVGIPSSISLVGNVLNTEDYVTQGNTVSIAGCTNVVIRDNIFEEFFVGVDLELTINKNVTIRNNRFERADAADIIALARVAQIDGLVFSANNVGATATGPVGVALNSLGASISFNINIPPDNNWGALDASTTDFPISVVASQILNAPWRGNVPVITGGGAEFLDNIFDELGGITQLISGDFIYLHSTDATRVITVRNTGNINTAGSIVINTTSQLVALMWDSRLAKWMHINP